MEPSGKFATHDVVYFQKQVFTCTLKGTEIQTTQREFRVEGSELKDYISEQYKKDQEYYKALVESGK